jgi:Glycine cleavage system regulatory protein
MPRPAVKMKNYLVISALGKDKPGIVEGIARVILDSGCGIADSRMTVLGEEFAIIALITGNWNNLAKLESMLPALQKRLDIVVITKRTQEQLTRETILPYAVDVVAIEQSGIVYHLANFFSSRNINIEDMATNTYAASHTGASMFAVHMVVGIPSDTYVATLREEFMEFCDHLNLDAVIEPVKF